MKAAMWGVGLLVLSAFGFFLVNMFGNITVTNQLNYTAMRNTVEAAMYDAVDIAHYRSGFCFCTDKGPNFTSKGDYSIEEPEKNEEDEYVCRDKCKFVSGEYKIDEKVFKESLIRRFSELVNNNKNYRIVFQDIIEYPPKVSVRVDSSDEYAFHDEDGSVGSFTIVNQIDGLLEEREK